MRKINHVRAGFLVGALGIVVLAAGAAQAGTAALQTSTERPGSILIFPKVVRDGTRDTVIQISNTGNLLDSVRCFYLDGLTCTVRDFDLTLTKLQPTIWRVGDGRKVGSMQGGLDPGNIPAQPFGFRGALICTEVQPDFSDVSVGNHLKGEATLEPEASLVATGDRRLSKYNAVALQGGSGGTGNVLALDGSEYAACPAASVVDFIQDGNHVEAINDLGNRATCFDNTTSLNTGIGCNSDTDCTTGPCAPAGTDSCSCPPFVDASSVSTEVTFVPCTLDLESGFGSSFSVQLDGDLNEEGVKQTFSGSQPFRNACWGSFALGNVVHPTSDGDDLSSVRISTSTGSPPIVAVVESFFSDSIQNVGSAAVNPQMEGAETTGTLTLSTP
jgi:hypothetical protein